MGLQCQALENSEGTMKSWYINLPYGLFYMSKVLKVSIIFANCGINLANLELTQNMNMRMSFSN